MEKVMFIVLVIFTPKLVLSQGSRPSFPSEQCISEIGEVIEWLVEHAAGETNPEALTEQLSEISENPINLNSAQHDDLKRLMFLNDQQIFNLITYRIHYRQFYSLYELQAVDGFDPVTIRHLLPFIRIGPVEKVKKTEPKAVFRFGKHTLLIRAGRILEPRKGYQSDNDSLGSGWSNRYLGSPERIFFRYRFQYSKKIFAGFSAEKDPGEMLIFSRRDPDLKMHLGKGGIHGFDAYSFFASYKSSGLVRNILAGDYQIYAGQGLTLGGSGSFGQPLDYGGIKPSLSGIRPHSGADENRYFRGIAAEFQSGSLRVLLFLSHHTMDASVPDSIPEGSGQLPVTPDYTGYHRTIKEYSKKNTLQVSSAGGHVCFEKKTFRFGLSAVGTRYRLPVKGGSGHLAKVRPVFSGQEQVGLDYRFLTGVFHFFGEWSLSGKRVLAMVHGVTALLHAKANLTLLYRNYPVAYQNIYSNGYSRRDSYNEKGFSVQFVMLPFRKLTLQGLFDYSVHPWLRYRTDRPSQGRDMTFFMEYQVNPDMILSSRIRHTRYQQNVGTYALLRQIGDVKKTSYRIQLRHSLSSSCILKSRIEWVDRTERKTNPTTGFLAMTGFRWTFHSDRVITSLNYSIFDTWSYAERIYAYEPDVLYSYTSQVFFDRGMRWAGLVRWRIAGYLSIWLKVARVWYRDLNTLGSGPETIEGNKKTEVKFQFIFQL